MFNHPFIQINQAQNMMNNNDVFLQTKYITKICGCQDRMRIVIENMRADPIQTKDIVVFCRYICRAKIFRQPKTYPPSRARLSVKGKIYEF